MERQTAEGIEMPQSDQPTRHVVVAGDVTIDWNLARSGEQSAHAYWSSGRQTKASRQAGGAALLGSVVERMVRDCFPPGVKVWRPGVDPNYQGRRRLLRQLLRVGAVSENGPPERTTCDLASRAVPGRRPGRGRHAGASRLRTARSLRPRDPGRCRAGLLRTARRLAGHRYGAPTQKDQRIHSCLLTWRKMTEAERRLRYGAWAGAIGEPELPDTGKEKDRILIRAIPRILKTAGLQVTPIPRSQPEARAGA